MEFSKALDDHKRVYRYMLRIAEARQARVLAQKPDFPGLTMDMLESHQWFDEEDEQTELFSTNSISSKNESTDRLDANRTTRASFLSARSQTPLVMKHRGSVAGPFGDLPQQRGNPRKAL